MKKIILSTIAMTSLLFASNSAYKYEITPVAGQIDTKQHVDLENHKVGGIFIGINKDKDCKFDQIEFGALHSHGVNYNDSDLETDITRLFASGIKEYKINDTVQLHALAGLGYEHINTDLFHNDSDAFFNYGVGAKFKVNNDISLKLEARHLLKFDGDKNVLYTIGLSIPFGPKAKKVVPKQDDDKDGVINSQDKCLTTPAGEKVDVDGCTLLMKPENLNILFHTNSAVIISSDEVKFKKYVTYLNKVKSSKVIIEGHTDSDASNKYNQTLSEKRANSAKNKLIDMGIDASRVTAIGHGETQPLVANTTKENKQKNRRVTARIVK